MVPHPAFILKINHKIVELNTLSQITFLEPWQQAIQTFILDFISPQDYIESFTSGSTGTPKRIEIKKQTMKNSATLTAQFFGLQAKTTALLCLSADYIAGKMMLVRAMTQGWEIDCVAPTSTPLNPLNKYQLTAMIPAQALASKNLLQQVNNIIIGGAPISAVAEAELLALNHSGLFQTFGMTETTSHIALKKLGQKWYTTLPGIRISKNQKDCLVIDAPMLVKNPLPTNDIVEIKSPNTFAWLGRFDHVINTGGFKVFAEVLEQKIATALEQAFFVHGKADDKWGQKIVLFIEGKKPENSPDFSACALLPHEKPKEIIYIPQFSRTDSGKVKRVESAGF